MTDEHPELEELRRRLAEQEEAYAAALDALDALAGFPLPAERRPEIEAHRAELNELAGAPAPEPGKGAAGRARDWAVAPLRAALDRQRAFDSELVRLLNAHVEESGRVDAHLRDVVSALIRYLQQVLPLVDARDRVASALSTTRAELVLEAFDRRLESLSRRLQGLLAIRDRVEALGEEVRALRAPGAPPLPAPAVSAALLDDAAYVAFENRFRGSRDEVRSRVRPYVDLFAGRAPVADLGCGRGEFLELLREAGVEGLGADSNAQSVAHCRERGLAVSQSDLLSFLAARADASLGGVFAAQVAEHLPPRVLLSLLRESHRVLRREGLLVLETVNPRSVTGFLEVYTRDLTHERPLHPETLSFLAAAAGFSDVRVEMRSPVEPAAQLQAVPADGLPPSAAQALNENVERLNALLYGPQEYALLARR
jgi:O-antigen chain-terminating methyltransferase